MQKMKKENVPKKFYKDGVDGSPVIAYTVGDLIKALSELPKDLNVHQGYSNYGGAVLVVYNIHHDAHLSFEENEYDDSHLDD